MYFSFSTTRLTKTSVTIREFHWEIFVSPDRTIIKNRNGNATSRQKFPSVSNAKTSQLWQITGNIIEQYGRYGEQTFIGDLVPFHGLFVLPPRAIV